MDENKQIILANLRRFEAVYTKNPSSTIAYAIKAYREELERYNKQK